MADRLFQPNSQRPMVNNDLSPSQQLNTWFNVITKRSMIMGDGPPEGVVEAEQSAMYMDKLGVSGAVLYIKRDSDILGDKTLGWLLV